MTALNLVLLMPHNATPEQMAEILSKTVPAGTYSIVRIEVTDVPAIPLPKKVKPKWVGIPVFQLVQTSRPPSPVMDVFSSQDYYVVYNQGGLALMVRRGDVEAIG